MKKGLDKWQVCHYTILEGGGYATKERSKTNDHIDNRPQGL